MWKKEITVLARPFGQRAAGGEGGDRDREVRKACVFLRSSSWGEAGRRQAASESAGDAEGCRCCEGQSYCVDVSACPLSTTCAGGIVMSAGANVPAMPLHHAIVQRHFRDPIAAAGDVRTSRVNSVFASNVARHRCRLTAGEAESRSGSVLAHR